MPAVSVMVDVKEWMPSASGDVLMDQVPSAATIALPMIVGPS